MSVACGQYYESRALNEFERTKRSLWRKGDNVYMKLGVNEIPSLLLDTTDRCGTAPFAFAYNKFEFRAVGSVRSRATTL